MNAVQMAAILNAAEDAMERGLASGRVIDRFVIATRDLPARLERMSDIVAGACRDKIAAGRIGEAARLLQANFARLDLYLADVDEEGFVKDGFTAFALREAIDAYGIAAEDMAKLASANAP